MRLIKVHFILLLFFHFIPNYFKKSFQKLYMCCKPDERKRTVFIAHITVWIVRSAQRNRLRVCLWELLLWLFLHSTEDFQLNFYHIGTLFNIWMNCRRKKLYIGCWSFWKMLLVWVCRQKKLEYSWTHHMNVLCIRIHRKLWFGLFCEFCIVLYTQFSSRNEIFSYMAISLPYFV